MAGTATPFTAWAVQLQAELDSAEIKGRLRRLEDPISALHPGVQDASEEIYRAICATGRTPVVLAPEAIDRHRRPLEMLHAKRYIDATHTLGGRFNGGLWLNDPAYVIWLCALFADGVQMQSLVSRLDAASPGTQIRGRDISADLGLPLPLVKGVFEFFADRGLGIVSKESGAPAYIARA